jgi:hypothetical protein
VKGSTVLADETGDDTTESTSENLITNGDFDAVQATTGWSLTPEGSDVSMSVGTNSGDSNNSTYVLKLYNSTTWSDDTPGCSVNLTQEIATLPEGSYTFKMSVMGGAGASGLSLILNGEVDSSSWVDKTVYTWGEWQDISFDITIDSGQTNYVIGIAPYVYSSNTLCIDNISLVKNEDDQDTSSETEEELLVNGDFESSIWDANNKGWITTPDAWDNFTDKVKDDTTQQKSDSQCLKVGFINDNTSISFSQSVTLAAGVYTISGYAKDLGTTTESATTESATTENETDTNETASTNKGTTIQFKLGTKELGTALTLTDTYQEFTGNFELSEETTCDISFLISGNESSEVYVDDVVLTKTGEYVVSIGSLNELINTVPTDYADLGFSSDSVEALKTALSDAESVVEKVESSDTTDSLQDDITAAYNALKDALANLSFDADLFVTEISDYDTDSIRGMDISSYLSIMKSFAQLKLDMEEAGATEEEIAKIGFKDWKGNVLDEAEFFQLLASAGVNYVRIRVWNDPYDTAGNGYGGR